MNRSDFERARSRLWARLHSLSQRDEAAGDQEEIRDALLRMEQHAADDAYWEGQVRGLKDQVFGLPVFSRDPAKKQRVGYEPLLRQLENWSHSFKAVEPTTQPGPPTES